MPDSRDSPSNVEVLLSVYHFSFNAAVRRALNFLLRRLKHKPNFSHTKIERSVQCHVYTARDRYGGSRSLNNLLSGVVVVVPCRVS